MMTKKPTYEDLESRIKELKHIVLDSERAKEEHKESEYWFHKMFENVRIGIAMTDWAGHLQQCNPAYCDLLGYSMDELKKKPFDAIIHPGDLDENLSQIERLKAGELSHFVIENRYIHKSKDPIWVREYISILPDRLGRPLYLLALVSDISNDKNFQNQLLSIMSEAEKLANFGSWEWDMVRDKWTMSDNWLKIHGYTCKVLTTEELLTIAYPDDINRIQEAFNQCINNGKPYEIEHRIVRYETKEVRYIRAYGRVESDSTGKPVKLYGAAQDITEYKRQEVELKQSEEQYRTLVERTPDLITKVDSEGRIVFVNHAAQNVYGIPPEECLGRSAFDFIHPEDREVTVASFNRWLQCPDNIFTYENRIVSIDGQRTHHMTWMILPEHDENGSVIGFASTARDITEQKQAVEEKIKLENQLHQVQKIESIGQLAGGVAHDFNNMLGVIIGQTELALKKADPASPLISDLEEIRTAANRSADLTRQLLTFARKQVIAPKALDLNEAVGGILKMMHLLIGEDIQLSWNPAANLWPVKVDPSQLDQILANLCVNARDAIDGTGIISLKTANTSWDEAAIASRPYDVVPGDYVLLSVSDDGCGMDKKAQTHIFEPFYTTKEVGGGTGLGLATVYGAVKQNNGFLTFHSEPGLGTVFNIYLPRMSDAVEAEQETAEKPFLRGTETVLLVEDDEMLLRLVTTMLEESGYTVLTAATTELAQSFAREHTDPIHLLISDMIMPVMNGKELSKKLQPLRPEMKILFLSGYTADIISKQGVIEDEIHFLQKPFSFEALTTKVRQVLDDQESTVS